jgi:trigger factor
VKSAVETLNPTRVKLTVEVPFEELKPSLDAAYKKIAQQINIPGFRRGKVPAPIIDRQIGREVVLDQAINDALPKIYVDALTENEIVPMSQPEIDMGELEDGKQFSFTAELDVKPEIVLPDYDDIEAEVPEATVGDPEVEEQLESLRMRFGSLTPVDRAAADGDFVTIDLSAAKDGEPIEEAQATGMSYQIGRGTMLEGLDEALTGMAVDEEKTFPSTLVGGEYKDQQVDVTVKVTAVKEQELPELDDEFAQTASEFDTVDELRADIRDRLTRGARVEQAGAARDAVLEKLLERVNVPLPDSAVAEELASRRASIEQQLSYAGMTHADYLQAEEQTEEEFEAELDHRVRDAMTAQFLLDEIAVKEAINVEQNELTQHMIRRAQSSGQSPEDYVKHMMEHNHLPELVAEVRRGKALAMIVENATITDTSGNEVELKTLLPDGTYADPADLEAAAQAEAAAAAGEAAGDTTGADIGIVQGGDAASDVVLAGEYVDEAPSAGGEAESADETSSPKTS